MWVTQVRNFGFSVNNPTRCPAGASPSLQVMDGVFQHWHHTSAMPLRLYCGSGKTCHVPYAALLGCLNLPGDRAGNASIHMPTFPSQGQHQLLDKLSGMPDTAWGQGRQRGAGGCTAAAG